MTPKYGVHMGASNTSRDYQTANSLKEAADLLRDFADGVGAVTYGPEMPGAWAYVDLYDPRDNVHMSHSDYPYALFSLGVRGGIKRVSI